MKIDRESMKRLFISINNRITSHTHDVFVKSGSNAKAGMVPSPGTTAGTAKYLREDGTWQKPPNTTYSDMKASTTNAAGTHGLVPAPSAGASNRYLRSDGTWSVPPDTDTKYTHPTTSGNKHIPSGGSSGQILRWSADGTATWGNDNNTTYSNMTGATASTAGKSGLIPAPAAGAQSKYLRGDGTWQTPPDTNTTYTNFVKSGSGGKAGLVPSPGTTAGTKKNVMGRCNLVYN